MTAEEPQEDADDEDGGILLAIRSPYFAPDLETNETTACIAKGRVD